MNAVTVNGNSNRPDIICQAPMSYVGAWKRVALWTSGIANKYARNSALYAGAFVWWVLVTAWYLFIIGWMLPLLWMYPYRQMRHRQRQERAIRALANRVTIAEAAYPPHDWTNTQSIPAYRPPQND